ncbi:SET domain-containing protein [Candidatus Falkowbacteria bacterium]|jgi:uncharacterized protein|nr:SET domain-containing protein [Candidatus Falkowbacteria bacterium]MBT7007208.1 SET domain-containing protein [Candidatus Falkowbacteria bacterium]
MTKHYLKDTKRYGKSIFTNQSIKKDKVIFTIQGPTVKIPSIYTVPIDHDLYIDPSSPGKFLNHSCEPTCGIKNKTQVVAMNNLQKDDEITIDYAMIVPQYDDKKLKQNITCHCGSKKCRGEFGSYKTLSPNLKQKYRDYISDYLINEQPHEE